jgi:hypothetical protein
MSKKKNNIYKYIYKRKREIQMENIYPVTITYKEPTVEASTVTVIKTKRKSSRASGTNPRAKGTNPRKKRDQFAS